MLDVLPDEELLFPVDELPLFCVAIEIDVLAPLTVTSTPLFDIFPFSAVADTEIFPEFPAVRLTLCAPPSIHTLSLDNVPFVADKFTLPIQSEEIVIVTVSPGLTVFLLVLIFIYAALTHLGNNIITRANIKIIIIFFVCVLFIFNHIPFL